MYDAILVGAGLYDMRNIQKYDIYDGFEITAELIRVNEDQYL